MSSRKFRKGDTYLIYWIDPHRGDGWYPITDKQEDKVYTCATFGEIIGDHADRITIAPTTSEDKDCLSPVTIPKVCIKKAKKLNIKVWD